MDYLDECSRMAYDAFSALDHDILSYNAIRSAEDAFTECLMYICIFYFIDHDMYPKANYLASEMERYHKESVPYTRIATFYKIYHESILARKSDDNINLEGDIFTDNLISSLVETELMDNYPIDDNTNYSTFVIPQFGIKISNLIDILIEND